MASRLADARDGGVELAAREREERLAELVVALADENANLRRALHIPGQRLYVFARRAHHRSQGF